MVVVIVLSLVAGVALAEEKPSRLEKGVKLGLSMANLNGGIVDGESKAGFAAGGYAGYKIADPLLVQIEALFVMKGAVIDTGLGLSESVRLNYLEIPLLVKASFPTRAVKKPSFYASDPGLTPYVCFGPAFAIKMSGAYAINEDTAEVETVDVGITFGGGFDAGVGKGKITVDLRFNLGIMDVVEVPWSYEITGETLYYGLKNRCFTVLVGYGF